MCALARNSRRATVAACPAPIIIVRLQLLFARLYWRINLYEKRTPVIIITRNIPFSTG